MKILTPRTRGAPTARTAGFAIIARGLAAGIGLAAVTRIGAQEEPRPRLVPYSPALAALAFELGLGDRVAGVARWTRLPPGETRPIVGDAASVDVESLLAARPDIVFVQGERIAGFDVLARLAPSIRVDPLRIETLADIAPAARRMAALGGAGPAAESAIADFERAVAALPAAPPGSTPRVIFVLGAARPTAAGPGTFVGDLIEHCGGVNAGRDVAGPLSWRPTDVESIARAAPDVLICQVDESESAEAARAWWLARTMIPAARSGRVVVVDEPEWTIPSLRTAQFIPRMAAMIHGK